MGLHKEAWFLKMSIQAWLYLIIREAFYHIIELAGKLWSKGAGAQLNIFRKIQDLPIFVAAYISGLVDHFAISFLLMVNSDYAFCPLFILFKFAWLCKYAVNMEARDCPYCPLKAPGRKA